MSEVFSFFQKSHIWTNKLQSGLKRKNARMFSQN